MTFVSTIWVAKANFNVGYYNILTNVDMTCIKTLQGTSDFVSNRMAMWRLLVVGVYIWHISFDVHLQIWSVTFQNKIECHLASFFVMSPQFGLCSRTCHVNFHHVNRHMIYFFTSHNTCQLTHFFACKFLSVKCQKLAKLCQNTCRLPIE